MKKITALVLTCALLAGSVFMLTSCSTSESTSKNIRGYDRLIVGITNFRPMNFLDAKQEWTGFDTDFAIEVGRKLGIPVQFQRIEWARKFLELEAGAINVIWNGMTANVVDAVTGLPRNQSVDFTYSYMLNTQAIVIRTARLADFQNAADLVGKTVAAEAGSAGQTKAVQAVGNTGTVITPLTQIATFIEVKGGHVDFAVVDILLAREIVGQGDYTDLTIAPIAMPDEVYAIGFRKGSPMVEIVNAVIVELFEEGFMQELAKKYGLESKLALNKNPIE